MPVSNLLHMPTVVHFVTVVQPRSILDIGIGMGSYGFLLRQYLDISKERLERSDWRVKIDGIEVFEGYRNPVWDYVYNNVVLSDIRLLIDDLESYDVIICNDVLEHFVKDYAILLIEQLLKRSRVLIATTPNRECPQGAWGGNEHEEHHCLLDASDFPRLIARKVTGITTCYVCCSDPSLVDRLKMAEYTCPVSRPEQWPYLKWRVRQKLQRITNSFMGR